MLPLISPNGYFFIDRKLLSVYPIIQFWATVTGLISQIQKFEERSINNLFDIFFAMKFCFLNLFQLNVSHFVIKQVNIKPKWSLMINIIFVDKYLQFYIWSSWLRIKVTYQYYVFVCLFVCLSCRKLLRFWNFQQFLWIVKNMEDISWPRGDTGSRKAHLLRYFHAWEPSK